MVRTFGGRVRRGHSSRNAAKRSIGSPGIPERPPRERVPLGLETIMPFPSHMLCPRASLASCCVRSWWIARSARPRASNSRASRPSFQAAIARRAYHFRVREIAGLAADERRELTLQPPALSDLAASPGLFALAIVDIPRMRTAPSTLRTRRLSSRSPSCSVAPSRPPFLSGQADSPHAHIHHEPFP